MRLKLHIPSLEELNYQERLLSQPETMAYNRGYDLTFEGYDRTTGCIAFPREKWEEWYSQWIGAEPERFYAYLQREEDGVFVGDVNFHCRPGEKIADMGVVIEAAHRGKGYAAQALELLAERALLCDGREALRNVFEPERTAALRAHLRAGFERQPDCGDGFAHLLLTREKFKNR